MKRFLIGASVGAILLGNLVVPAFASPAAPNAQCDTGASSGAFVMGEYNYGFLGQPNEDGLRGTPGYHDGTRGQDLGATGYNNSHVCGNP